MDNWWWSPPLFMIRDTDKLQWSQTFYPGFRPFLYTQLYWYHLIQQPKYDQSYHEWAAAKGIQKWGKWIFNLWSLFGSTATKHYPPSSMGKSLKWKATAKVCSWWNDGVHYDSSTCRFYHYCSFCGGSHQARGCFQAPKHAKRIWHVNYIYIHSTTHTYTYAYNVYSIPHAYR